MKLFIIGLPRTGTTSLCATLLELGFKTAHTAFTIEAVEQAEAIADTPAYVDYPFFDQRYPGSKFIYLERELAQWLPSIKGLLNRMEKNINNDGGGFNPVLKRCFKHVFAPFDIGHINDDAHLTACYLKHRQQAQQYFQERSGDFLTLSLSDDSSLRQLKKFLNVHASSVNQFPHLNKGQSVIGWNRIDHPLKINPNLSGQLGRKYFPIKH